MSEIPVQPRRAQADMLYMVDMEHVQTDFLFARPSFLSGMARVLDLFGLFDSYNQSRNPEEADAKAMYADWRIVGQDIVDAVEDFVTTDPDADGTEASKQLSLFGR